MGTKDDKFLQDFEQIRKLIRMQFLYDDFTVDNAARISLSVSRYNELKSTLTAYIKSKDDNTENRRINKKKTFSLKNSMFVNEYNYLCDTFGAKNIVPSQFESYISILQLLSGKDKPVSLSELFSGITRNPENATLYNHINELSEMGYITVSGEGRQRNISLSENCLGLIESSGDMTLFLDMISLMRNVIPPYLCGNMMFKTAMDTFVNDGAITEYHNPFAFAQSHFEQALDDDVAWRLMCAIQKNNKISLRYREREKAVCPLEIVTNAETGRRYLLAADENGSLISLLLSQISYIDISDEVFSAQTLAKRLQENKKYSFTGSVLLREGQAPQTVELEFLPEMRDTMEKLFADIEITAQGDICSARVLINDAREIKPWLRRNMGSVRAKDGTPLAEEMAKDAENWRKVYGII